MSICNINGFHCSKCPPDGMNISILIYPKYSMANPVFRYKIIKRRVFLYLLYNLIDRLIRSVCQKNRPCLGIARIYMTDAVCFFFCTSIFMLFNYLVFIIIYRRTGHDTSLRPAIHRKFIYIVAALFVLDKSTVCHFFP